MTLCEIPRLHGISLDPKRTKLTSEPYRLCRRAGCVTQAVTTS